MSESVPKPRLGFLGAGPDEVELILDLRADAVVEILGVYDADPVAPGLAVAEVAGIPAGADSAALERLRGADVMVLPRDRRAAQSAVEWASGTRAELVSLPEARLRWGAAPSPTPHRASAPASAFEDPLRQEVDTSARLQDRRELADWLLGLAMRAAGANGGSIQLLAADSGELYMIAARGLSERLVRLGRHRVGEGVSGVVAATLAPQLLHGPKPGRMARERGDIAAAISLPLEDGGELVGVLNVSSTHVGQRFGEEHLHRLENLAPRVARLLRDATRLEPMRPGLDLPRLLRQLESEARDTPWRLAALCEHVRAALGADAAALYLATEDGDWRHVPNPASRPDASLHVPVRRAALDTALLETRWVHTHGGATVAVADPMAAAVDRALAPTADVRSQVCAPLLGLEPIGVVVLEFVALEAAERANRDGLLLIEQLAFGCDALLREHRQRLRLERFAALTRAVHRLHEHAGRDTLDAALAAEALRLVGGRRAFVRRVDEAQRTFSRPATAGVAPSALETWRNLDARITARTLQSRRALLTTAADDHEPSSSAETPHCSLVSVPLLYGSEIVAVLDVYEKQPQDFLENHAFSTFDRDLLEGLALIMAWPFAIGRVTPVAAHQPGRAPAEHPARSEPVEPAARAAPVATTAEATPTAPPRRGPETAPAPVAVALSPHAVLLELVQEAARDQRGLGVWLLHFDGLMQLGDSCESARRTLAATVQRGLRAGDRVGWISDQDLAVFGIEPPPPSVGFEARLAALVRPQLARLGRSLESGIELRIGASAFPEDGSDPIRLIAAAAERAR